MNRRSVATPELIEADYGTRAILLIVKRVAVLGSTGSIGTQTLDIIGRHPDRLKVTALAAGSNTDLLLKQAKKHGVTRLAVFDSSSAKEAGIPGGIEAIAELSTAEDVDIVVVSVAGVIGLIPTLAAIEARKQIALASKEVLVAAGEIVMPLVQKHGTLMTPIDSEHSAIFQCLQGYESGQIDELILTASGGPFRGRTRAELKHVTVNDALNHPTWTMGGKITIDSATLMNKGLEVIEAKWLFGVELRQVRVVVHPQSIIHSMIKFTDGSVLGQMGWPDMRLPIQYALLFPERIASDLKPWNPADSPTLSFEEPDERTFPAIQLARQASSAGGTAPCVLNAANEEAVRLFLEGRCGFLQIAEVVQEALSRHKKQSATLESLLEADKWARKQVAKLVVKDKLTVYG